LSSTEGNLVVQVDPWLQLKLWFASADAFYSREWFNPQAISRLLWLLWLRSRSPASRTAAKTNWRDQGCIADKRLLVVERHLHAPTKRTVVAAGQHRPATGCVPATERL